MEKMTGIGIELTQQEYHALNVEAAARGMSKRRLAQKIVSDWIKENNPITLRGIISRIMEGIKTNTSGEEQDRLLNTVIDFSDGCATLVRMIITEKASGKPQDKKETLCNELEANRKVLNDFCLRLNLPQIPELPIEKLVFEYVEEYRP